MGVMPGDELVGPDDPSETGMPELPGLPELDPSIWPEAPPWLFPAVMAGTGLIVAVVLVLILLWWRSARVLKSERETLPEREWVDLSKLAKGGRWVDEADQPRKPPADDAGDGDDVGSKDDA